MAMFGFAEYVGATVRRDRWLVVDPMPSGTLRAAERRLGY